MDVAESLVSRFLANNQHFISPQFNLHEEPNWNADLDFVVLDFQQEEIVAVEVSEDSGLRSVGKKARTFVEDNYFDKLKRQITQQTNGLTAAWSVKFLGFVRDDNLTRKAWKQFRDPRLFFPSHQRYNRGLLGGTYELAAA